MKKLSLKINELKVESFKINSEKGQKGTVAGQMMTYKCRTDEPGCLDESMPETCGCYTYVGNQCPTDYFYNTCNPNEATCCEHCR